MQSRRLPATCKLCSQPVSMVCDRSRPSVPILTRLADKSEKHINWHVSQQHESGLCFFHLKQQENLFDCKYPLALHGSVEQQASFKGASMKHAFAKAKGYVQK